jgi:magnesium transporter
MVAPQKTPEPKKLNITTITYGELTWEDIIEPTEEAKKYLAEKYHFHPMDLEDCFSRRQLSKVDIYGDYLFVIFHLPAYDKATRVSTIYQWSAFVGQNFLVTLRPGILSSVDELLRECKFDEDARKDHFSNGSGFLLYQMLDRAIDSYFSVLDKILGLMNDIEDNVFNEEIEASKEINILRRDIVTQRRVMFPTRALFTELGNKLRRFSRIDMSVYYGDLMDHVNKICETLDECKEIIEVYKDADSVLSSSRVNRLIRIFVVMLSVVGPLVVVSGIWGMGIILPGGAQKGSLQTFIILIAAALAVTASLLFLFRRKHFI